MFRFPPPKQIEVDAVDFEDWKSKHPELTKFIKITKIQEGQSEKEFSELRAANHSTTMSRLAKLVKRLESIEENLEEDLKTQERKYENYQPPILYYADSETDMNTRIMLYLQKKYFKTVIRFISDHINTIISRTHSINYFSKLLLSSIIPNDIYIEIDKSFYPVSPSEKLNQNSKALYTKYKEYEKMVKKFPIPLYIKNPKAYFNSLKVEAMQIAKENKDYFPYLEGETGFSIYLFRTVCVEGEKIDKFIAEQEEIEFIQFGEETLKLCFTLIPPTNSEEEKNTCIFLLFRQIMERAYEKYYKVIPMNKRIVEFMSITQKPMNQVLPVTFVTPFPPETPLKDAFLFDPLIKEAIGQLLFAVFVPNVVDSLYYISKFLEMIQNASIVAILQRQPTKDEVKTLVGFEETFSLLLGALLSSDIPDIFHYGSYVKRLAPLSRLSPDLEFAATNILAVLEHCISIE